MGETTLTHYSKEIKLGDSMYLKVTELLSDLYISVYK